MIHDIKSARQSGQVTVIKYPRAVAIKYLGGGILLVLGITLAINNPTKTDYAAFATQQATNFLKQEICDRPARLSPALQHLIGDGCSSVEGSQEDISRFIAYNTQRYNFIFFSLYTTDLPLRRVLILGIARNFFILDIL